MSKGFSGGCQCGAVRFHAAEVFDNGHICHCRMCQKAVGNYFAALVGVPKEALTWTRGAPALFRSSATVDRGFCKDCGTPLMMDEESWDSVGVMIGAFDHPQDIPLVSQDSVESRMPWFHDIVNVPDKGTSLEIDGPERMEAIASSNRQHPDHDTDTWPTKP